LDTAARKLELPDFPQLIRCFLYDQTYPNARFPSSQVSIDACPVFVGKISIFYSASATFRAPSDPSGPSSMRREYIRATPSWRKGHPRYDCIFINTQPELAGMRGLGVARVFLFFFHLCTGTPIIHAPSFNGSRLLVMNQMMKQASGWSRPMFAITNNHPWQSSISIAFIVRRIWSLPTVHRTLSTGYSQCTTHWTISKISMSISM
jgi:hypothetical protein